MPKSGSQHRASSSIIVDPVQVPIGSRTFQTEAQRTLDDLRSAFAALINNAPETIRRPVDLQRAIGVSAPVAWHIFRVATAKDPLLAAPYVPRRARLITFLTAARRHGMPAPVLERAEAALDAYEELQREHAGDRETLDTMIGALRTDLADGAAGHLDERTRRAAFKANSQLWGLQARVTARAMIFFPGRTPGSRGAAMLSCASGLHAVRPDVPLVVHSASRFVHSEPGEQARHAVPGEDRSGLLLEFCDPKPPGVKFRTDVDERGIIRTTIVAPGIGRRAAVTTFSLAVSEFPRASTDDVSINVGTYTPSELFHLEMLVPSGIVDPHTARMAVYGCRTDPGAAMERRPDGLVPISEPVVHISDVADVPPAAGIPRWPEAVRYVLDHVGARGLRFDLFRCRVPYPMLHTYTCLTVDIAGAHP
jgi:hypothetical protein